MELPFTELGTPTGGASLMGNFSSTLDLLSLSCLWNVQQAVGYTSLNFRGGVWAGDKMWESFNECVIFKNHKPEWDYQGENINREVIQGLGLKLS